MDKNIQQRGISLASKCSCCSNPNIESLEHLLFQGEVGTNIWGYFNKALNLSACWDMPSLLAKWLRKINLSKHFGIVTTSIEALTLWNIWLSRNSTIFARSSMSWICVKNQVIKGIHDLFASFKPKSHGSYLNQLSLNSLNINHIPINVRNGTWTKWQVPALGTLKFNMDGSSINNLCAGGGVVRDHFG
ncbi:hypothetical protein CFOL_v3_30170 [Cephalotus follicularis]|uniref:Reverse transcriptase zinc-binding domain-containing protein n=1 Tax=Cephalotus follicularis TaxID=3775 RepID=A0A1Q3D2U1_CEPFO|nr:hypothetical protein CFOL_v3_30170 [Cephalotus follicularis]